MHEELRPLDVPEELQPEPRALVRSLDYARDVGDDELRVVVDLDQAEVG